MTRFGELSAHLQQDAAVRVPVRPNGRTATEGPRALMRRRDRDCEGGRGTTMPCMDLQLCRVKICASANWHSWSRILQQIRLREARSPWTWILRVHIGAPLQMRLPAAQRIRCKGLRWLKVNIRDSLCSRTGRRLDMVKDMTRSCDAGLAVLAASQEAVGIMCSMIGRLLLVMQWIC